MTERKAHQTVVGFAAETNNVDAYARKKLEEKRCDWIVANKVGEAGAGFAAETNEVTLIAADGSSLKIGPTTKKIIAKQLIELVTPMA
jgi:phosphopantothenoylcysteine decarboxylase/phosphopantothenate--cysteine ligase